MDAHEKMGFAQLRRFIHDAVESLSHPLSPANEKYPRAKEELLALCDVLSAKAERLKRNAPALERPTYDGPKHPGYFFTPSTKLEALYAEQRRADRRVDEAIRYEYSKTYLEYIEDELERIESKTAPVEAREQREHNARLDAYYQARKPYEHRYQSWRAHSEKLHEDELQRDKAVRSAYRKVKDAFNPKRGSGLKGMGSLPFELAAPGEGTDNQAVYRYYREVLSQGGLDGFDQERLDNLLALPRRGWMRGTSGFYGYIVLLFDHTEKVIMECPVRDNAIYVLDSGERRLLEKNKQELIASPEAKRIFHTGDWYSRLKKELGIE